MVGYRLSQMAAADGPKEFGEILKQCVERIGTRHALGKLLGMSGSRVGRAIDGQYTFNIENCLRLADVMRESPTRILRAAGKIEIANLIERLYGKTTPLLSDADQQLLDLWNALPARRRKILYDVLNELTADERERERARRRERRTA